MGNPEKKHEPCSPCAKALGYFMIFLVLAFSGCSFLPSQTDSKASRWKLGCADPVLNEDVHLETASKASKDFHAKKESPTKKDPLSKEDVLSSTSIEALLTSGHTKTEQPTRGSEISLVTIEEDHSTAESALETSEMLRLPTPISDSESSEELGTSLQLQDVINSVIESYPLLEAAFFSRPIADGELLSAEGAFDLKLKGAGTSGPLGFYETQRFGAGASQPLFSGGEIFGGYRIGRGNFQPWYRERQTNNGGEFNAGFSVPLRQNRQIDARRAAIFRATYGRDAVEPDIQSQILAFVWEASYSYWQWVAAGENFRIASSLLEIAQERNGGLNKRVDMGDLPQIEMTDNQRLIVSRQAELIVTQRKLQQSAIKLSLFLRAPEGEPIIPTEAQLPATFPEATAIDSEQMEDDIQLAILNRPELVSLELFRMQLDVDLAQARNLYLPEVDAILFTSQDMGAPTSSKRDKSPFELEASLQVSVPLQRRKARGKMQAIEGKLQQLSAKTRFTQDKIAADVQKVYAALLATHDRIVKARESLELTRTMERAEQRKFQLGDSDLLRVNLREQSTASAAKNVVQALLDYFQAQADYRAAIALDDHQVL